MKRGTAATLLLPLILITTPPRLHAQRACAGLTQREMTECSSRRLLAVERRLTALLGELYPRLDTARAGALRRTQASWRGYRDQHCHWDADSYRGGSVWTMWFDDCATTLTEERIEALRFHLCHDDAGMAGECTASRRYASARARRSSAAAPARGRAALAPGNP
jgi:uncharacterized protein YecT (DUF1311 family)